jgi:hypothetical protein
MPEEISRRLTGITGWHLEAFDSATYILFVPSPWRGEPSIRYPSSHGIDPVGNSLSHSDGASQSY